jgi:hypothetical protein
VVQDDADDGFKEMLHAVKEAKARVRLPGQCEMSPCIRGSAREMSPCIRSHGSSVGSQGSTFRVASTEVRARARFRVLACRAAWVDRGDIAYGYLAGGRTSWQCSCIAWPSKRSRR